MREVADVHRELFAENADLYGDDVRGKIERCLEVTDAEAERAATARSELLAQAERALADLDLLISPTLASVAPARQGEPGDLRYRRSMVRFTFPLTLGWPALALPCGAAEEVAGVGADRGTSRSRCPRARRGGACWRRR